MLRNLLIILLVVFAAIGVEAQSFNPYGYGRSYHRRTKSTFVHSVNLTVGMYSPEMDYWNDTYLPREGSSDELGASLLFGGNITFNLSTELRARLGASYWSDDAEKSGVGFKNLKVSFTRLSIGGFYAPKFASFGDGFQLYAGLEGYAYDINNTLDTQSAAGESSSEDQNGHDISFAPVIGIDKIFGDNFIIGVEFGYMFGEYIQAEIEESIRQKVSIAGPQMSFSIGYKFSSSHHF